MPFNNETKPNQTKPVGDVRGLMGTVVGNGHSDTSSNPRR